MPDQFTDEQIEDLFADLRADAMTYVRPPGVRAVRHTVRHRRTVRSVAAGAAVLAVAGGVVVTGHTGSPTGRAASGRHAAGDALDRSTLESLSEQAATVVGLEALDPDRPAYQLSSRGPVAQHSIRSHRVLGGTYTITMSCAGDDGNDDLDVVLRSGRASADVDDHPELLPVLWQESLVCRPASTIVRTATFEVPADGMFAVEVQPDASAVGRVAFAYRADLRPADQRLFTDRTSEKVSGAALPEAVVFMSQFLDDAVARQQDSVSPGAYQIRMSCAGTGTVHVSVRLYPDGNAADPLGGDRAVLAKLTCGSAPNLSTAEFVKVGTGAMVVRLEPDDTARGQAAVSLRVDAV